MFITFETGLHHYNWYSYSITSHSITYGQSFMYADDTVIVSASKSLEGLEVHTFTTLTLSFQYCHNNDLIFNECKTKQLMFGSWKDAITGLPNLLMQNSISHLGVVSDLARTCVFPLSQAQQYYVCHYEDFGNRYARGCVDCLPCTV